jgi:peroxiredoxin
MRKLVAIILIFAGAATCLAMNPKTLHVGDKAPSFTLRTMDGVMVSLSMLCGEKLPAAKRKVVVLDFFQTTCKPCLEELPEFVRFYQKWKEDARVQFYMVGVGEDAERIRKFHEEKRISLPVLCDPFWNMSKGYGVTTFPVAIIIDREGIIRMIVKNKQPNIGEILDKSLDKILGAH